MITLHILTRQGTRWLRLPLLAWPTTVSTPAFAHMMSQLLSQLAPPAATNIATPSSLTAARPTLLQVPSMLEPILLGQGSPLKCRGRRMLWMCRLIRLPLQPRRLRLLPLRRQLPRLLEPRRRQRRLHLPLMPDRPYLILDSRTLPRET